MSAPTCTCSIGRAGPSCRKTPQRLGFPVNWDGPPRASKQAGPTGWDGAGPGRVGSGGVGAGGKGLHPGFGVSSVSYFFLFIYFPTVPGRWPRSWGGRGWEGGETGRRGAGSAVKRLKRAGGDRAGRQAQGCAGPASAEGRRPRQGWESPCSVRPGSPGLRESARGAAGEDFARRGAPRVALQSCPGRGAESCRAGLCSDQL